MARFSKLIEPLFMAFRQDIFKFAALLNFKPTWQQAQLLTAVQRGHKRIAVKSGQGPGKTTILALVALWRAIRNADALTVVTAPTMRQCRDFLAEVRKHVERADPLIRQLIEVTETRVRIAGRHKWGIETVTASRPENAAGKHNDHMTILVDEASGVPRPIIEQFEGTLTNDDALFIMSGNPTTRDSAFFDCFNLWRHRWHTITFNGEESPIVSKENIGYLQEKYGKESDTYRIRVLGEFPNVDPNCVISSEDAEACSKTNIYELCQAKNHTGLIARQFGIDLSRFGGDESAIYRRTGLAIVERAIYHRTDPNVVVDRAFLMQHEASWRNDETWYVPDAGGIGQGVMRKFYQAEKQVLEFHSAGRAFKDREFDNKITEAWFGLGALMKKRNCYVPLDPRLIQQLCTRQYTTTAAGKLIVESKKDYKKRMEAVVDEGGSPDRADALVMAFYEHTAAMSQQGSLAGKVK